VSRTNRNAPIISSQIQGGLWKQSFVLCSPDLKYFLVSGGYIGRKPLPKILIGGQNIMERTIKRGDIFYADLNPVVGSEQGGTRPVLVISNDIGNRHSPTVIVAAITSRVHTKAKLPTHTAVNDFEGLDKDSIILLEQIRTIDKQRLKQHMGMMPENIMARVDKALAISISLNNRPNGKCAN